MKGDITVARLAKEIAKELGLTERLSTLTLHASTDKTCTALNQLDSSETLADELKRVAPAHDGKWFIVVKAATAAAPKRKYTL